jgi:hypothetical protein
MRGVPRLALQTLTICLIAAAAGLWWYLETQEAVLLVASVVITLAGIWAFRSEIKAVRAGRKDPQGITSVFGDLRTKLDKTYLLIFSLLPVALSIYSILKERTLIPPDIYDTDRDPVVWFMYAAISLALAIWVHHLKERAFWILATLVFVSYGSRPLMLSLYPGSQTVRDLAIVLWASGAVTGLALLFCGLWLLNTCKEH